MRVRVPTLLLVISGCAPQDDAQLMLADAGSIVQGQAGQTYTLDGSDSMGESLLWRFVQLPEGSALADQDLVDARTAQP